MDSKLHHSRSYGGGAMPFILHFCAELGRVLTSNERLKQSIAGMQDALECRGTIHSNF